MIELPKLVRQCLAVTLLIIAFLSCWSFLLHPLYRSASFGIEELDDARFELQRLKTITKATAATTPGAIRAQLDSLQNDLFAMQSVSDADVHFITTVDHLIRSSGVRLLQLKGGVPTQAGSLTRYSAYIQATGKESNIVRLLSSIEQHRPLIVVEHAVLVSQANPFSEAGFNAAPELTVQLGLVGFGADTNRVAPKVNYNAR